ncbi:MAG: transcription antitermination factor NusB [Acidobacteriota bacterium]
MAARPSGSFRRDSQSSAPRGVRAAAAWALERTLTSQGPADVYLESAMARFDDRDKGLLHELVLGTLRWMRRIDDVLAAASHRGLAEIEAPLLAPMRLAVYQLLFLDRVPAHAAVDEAVEHASHLTHRGGGSFANAVLRRVARAPTLAEWPVRDEDPVRRLGIEYSHPDLLVERWIERFGRERAIALLQADNQPKPLHLLAFRSRGGREQLAEDLIDEGLEVRASSISPLGLSVRSGNPFATAAFRRGDFYVQDEASQAAALIPPPVAGERIFDAAAAPGGKSAALLAWQENLQLVAADISAERLRTLRANIKRLRLPIASLVADAERPALRGGFDRVVLDLPCSGTGTLRKHPELKWRISESEIGRLSRQALRMLAGCAPLVGAGGRLVAITCSLEPEENEQVVASFLAEHSDFEPEELTGQVPAALERHLISPGFWRLATAGDHDGFTVHVLKRRR